MPLGKQDYKINKLQSKCKSTSSLKKSSPNYLIKRGGIYYFRIRVPTDIYNFYNKKELKKSLHTRVLEDARALVRSMVVETLADFSRKRQLLNKRSFRNGQTVVLNANSLSIELFTEAIIYIVLLHDDEYRLINEETESEFIEAVKNRKEALDFLKTASARGKIEVIEPPFHFYMHALNVSFTGTESEMNVLKQKVLRAVLQVQLNLVARDNGEVVRTPEPSYYCKRLVSQVQNPIPNVMVLFDEWLKYAPRSYDMKSKVGRASRRLHDYLDGSYIPEIRSQNIEGFLRSLIENRGLQIKTAKDYRSSLNSLFKFAADQKYIEYNPVCSITGFESRVKTNSWKPYTSSDLKKILSSGIFAESYRPEQGGGEAAPWLILLSLYGGARREELAQLRNGDVKCEGDIWYLSITDLPDEDECCDCDKNNELPPKKIKNEASRRDIPIHVELISAGFLNYVKLRKGKHSELLFPDLKADSKNRLGGTWGKWFSGYLRDVIGIKDPLKVYHSFRGTFRDALREAEVASDISDALMGHDEGKISKRYGDGFSLRTKKRAIDTISYRGITVPVVSKQYGQGKNVDGASVQNSVSFF